MALRNHLRWSLQNTLLLYIGCIVYSWIIRYLIASESLEGFLYDVVFYALLFSLFKEKPLKSVTLVMIFWDIFNLFSNMFIVLAYGCLNLSKGHLPWLVLDQAGTGFRIIIFILTIPAFLIAYKIVLLFKEHILSTMGILKWALFVMFPVRTVLLAFLRDFCTSDYAAYRNNPDGILLVIDTIEISLVVIGLLVLIISRIYRSRKSYCRLQTDAAVDAAKYEDAVEEMKTNLHQVEHDRSNWQNHGHIPD